MLPLPPMRRLYERGPRCHGLAVDAAGVVLGPDCILVQRLPDGGYRSADANALALLAHAVFEDDTRLRRLPIVLSGIVAALDRGDLVKAQLLGLEIPIDRLDELRLERLHRAAELLKYDSGELRDQNGRWAREDNAVPKASLLRRLAPAALRALAQLGARIVAAGALEATAFLGIIFIPTNRSLISQGPVPNKPDLSYEYDAGAGRLRLYRQDGDNRILAFEGHPDVDGIIRDKDGRAIGRRVDGSVVILDPDGLQGSKDEEPKLCPAPTKDRQGPKEKDIEYQHYVSTLVNPDAPLPRGLAVKLYNPVTGKDVYFDDCRLTDATMIDAKGTGYLDMLNKESKYPWAGVEEGMLDQAERQLQAARTRAIEWHFAEKEVADRVRKLFSDNDVNITVIYTPPPVVTKDGTALFDSRLLGPAPANTSAMRRAVSAYAE